VKCNGKRFASVSSNREMATEANGATQLWVGTGGRGPGRKGAGGGRREGGKRKSQGGGNREKLRKFRNILLYFAIEMGQKGGNHYEKGRKRE